MGFLYEFSIGTSTLKKPFKPRDEPEIIPTKEVPFCMICTQRCADYTIRGFLFLIHFEEKLEQLLKWGATRDWN